jgi:hypothetical protein
MACDGLPLGVAFVRAGFKLNRRDAPSLLFALPRIQERAAAILEARRTSGVVSLSEVTDMLKRVFAGAHSAEEYSAAHNAAFSLARLYGHVTDKASVEVIRRPSRDPDEPAEQSLTAWVQTLDNGEQGQNPGQNSAIRGARASLLGNAPHHQPANVYQPAENVQQLSLDLQQPAVNVQPGAVELSNEINWLGGSGIPVGDRPENGAPVRPVTGTPISGGRSAPLGTTPVSEKGPPGNELQVPVLTGEFPPMEDLF